MGLIIENVLFNFTLVLFYFIMVVIFNNHNYAVVQNKHCQLLLINIILTARIRSEPHGTAICIWFYILLTNINTNINNINKYQNSVIKQNFAV